MNCIRNIYKKSSNITYGIWNGFQMMANIENNSSSKVAKISQKIGTHNGVFHCDEALACYMLKILPEFVSADIIRTRDYKELEECDIVVDVGSIYDPKTHRYDHHQKSFEETLNSVRPDLVGNKFNIIRLSSAGLVYAHFGLEILTELLKLHNKIPSSECLKALFIYVYGNFIEELDAIDNGIPMYAEGMPRYKINTHLGARVHRINSAWNNSNPEPDDVLFEKAMKLVGTEFTDVVLDCFTVWWPAREVVKRTIDNRKEFHDSGEILVFSDRCSWKSHLYDIEEEMNIKGEIKFLVFHDQKGDSWRVQGVPVQPDSFICRVFLHKDWRGLRDDEVSTIANIKGCTFCHASGFIGGNKTKEGAIEMALKSLEAHRAEKN